MERLPDPPIGTVFHRWMIIDTDESKATGEYRRKICRCVCGVVKSVALRVLKQGGSKSCGCLQRESAACINLKHGHTRDRYIPAEFNVWWAMKQRCTNPNNRAFKHYGGRGITVCDRWLESYDHFISDMGTRPETGRYSIDRIDNNGNYTPDNCRWTTQAKQTRNRRTNHLMTLGDKTQCLTDWAAELHMPACVLFARLKLGWGPHRALATPYAGPRQKRQHR